MELIGTTTITLVDGAQEPTGTLNVSSVWYPAINTVRLTCATTGDISDVVSYYVRRTSDVEEDSEMRAGAGFPATFDDVSGQTFLQHVPGATYVYEVHVFTGITPNPYW